MIPKNKPLEQKIRNVIKSRYGIDIDNTNLEIEEFIDYDMSVNDNVKIILDKLKAYYPELVDKDLLNEKEKYEAWQRDYENELREQEYKELIENVEKNNIKDLEVFYDHYYKHVDAFLENKEIKGFVVIGKAGIGKSYNLVRKFKEKNVNFVAKKGHLSPFSLFQFLEKNNDKVVVLDDPNLNNKEVFNILIQALDTTTNNVEWTTTKNGIIEEYGFNFYGKIIIITNKLGGNSEILNALRDRCIIYDMAFSRNEMLTMMYIVAKNKGYDLSLIDYLKELNETQNIDLSLRLLEKVNTYSKVGGNINELIKEIAVSEKPDILKIVEELVNSGISVKEQVKKFYELTGMTERTYFRYKKKLGILSSRTDTTDRLTQIKMSVLDNGEKHE